jgi:hypothetical protein
MAETYYKYQERDQQAQINWAEVGKNFSETLQSEAESREKKKAAIDEATRKYQNNLDSQPHGTSTTIRQWGLNFGASAQEVMLMQEKLLKSGQLDPSDYTIMRQNLVDGTDDAFDLMQYYQDEYATKMERMNEADPAKASQYLETWLMENVEGFGDFNRSEAFINPRNGQVMAAFKKKNEKSGVMELDTSPDNMRSVSSLKGNILGKFNKYQLENETSSFVASQGNWEEVTRTLGSSQKAGLLEILSDPMAKTMTKEQLIALKLDPSQAETVNYYFESEQAWITAQMSNDYNVSSMLTDYVTRTSDGSKYAYTYDAEKAKNDSSLILLNDDGQGRPVPEFNDEQEEDVRKKIATSIRSKINKSTKTQGMSDYNNPQKWQQTARERRAQEENEGKMVTNVRALYDGSPTEINTAISFLRSINPDITHIRRTDDAVEVTYSDDRIETLSLSDAGDARSWTVGNTNFFLPEDAQVYDIEATLRRGGGDDNDEDRPLSVVGDDVESAGSIVETEAIDNAFKKAILSRLADLEISSDEDEARDAISAYIGAIEGLGGVKVIAPTDGTDLLKIMDSDDNLLLKLDLEGLTDAKRELYKNKIAELATSRATIEQKGLVTQNRRGEAAIPNTTGGESR